MDIIIKSPISECRNDPRRGQQSPAMCHHTITQTPDRLTPAVGSGHQEQSDETKLQTLCWGNDACIKKRALYENELIGTLLYTRMIPLELSQLSSLAAALMTSCSFTGCGANAVEFFGGGLILGFKLQDCWWKRELVCYQE